MWYVKSRRAFLDFSLIVHSHNWVLEHTPNSSEKSLEPIRSKRTFRIFYWEGSLSSLPFKCLPNSNFEAFFHLALKSVYRPRGKGGWLWTRRYARSKRIRFNILILPGSVPGVNGTPRRCCCGGPVATSRSTTVVNFSQFGGIRTHVERDNQCSVHHGLLQRTMYAGFHLWDAAGKL